MQMQLVELQLRQATAEPEFRHQLQHAVDAVAQQQQLLARAVDAVAQQQQLFAQQQQQLLARAVDAVAPQQQLLMGTVVLLAAAVLWGAR